MHDCDAVAAAAVVAEEAAAYEFDEQQASDADNRMVSTMDKSHW
jgi:hypothetical protein